jgi:hypothetical protein
VALSTCKPEPEWIWPEGVAIEKHAALRAEEARLLALRLDLSRTAADLDRFHTRTVALAREFRGQLAAVVADPAAFERHFRGLELHEKRAVLNLMERDPSGLEARLGGAGRLASRSEPGAGEYYAAFTSAPSVARLGHSYLDRTQGYHGRLVEAAAALGIEGATTRTRVRAMVDTELTKVAGALDTLSQARRALGTEPEHGAAYNRLSQFNRAEQRAVAERFPLAAEAMRDVAKSRFVVVFDMRRARRESLVDHSGQHRSVKSRQITKTRTAGDLGF